MSNDLSSTLTGRTYTVFAHPTLDTVATLGSVHRTHQLTPIDHRNLSG